MINKKVSCKGVVLILTCMMCSFIITGCTKKINVTINDGYVNTKLSVSAGQSVAEAMAAAEIMIYDEDSVEPAMNTEINADTEIYIKRYAKVLINADEIGTEIELHGAKVIDALRKAGIRVGENDLINCNQEAYLENGMDINIIRRKKVTVTVDGNTNILLTEADNVDELLQEQNILVGDKDEIIPKKTDTIYDGMEISIKRKEIIKEVVREEIDFEVEFEYTDTLPSGTSKVQEKGKSGIKEVTYQVTYVDGIEEHREAIKEKVVEEPQNEIVYKGTKKSGKEIISKEKVYDCDGSGHGYYIITYADGTVEYEDF